MKVTVFSGKMDGVFSVKGDYFLGSYLTGANVFGNRVRILDFDPSQKRGGANVKDLMLAFRAKGTILEIAENVELLPILAVTATFACSETQIRLKEVLKENAQFIEKTVDCISKLGGEAQITDYGVRILGRSFLKGGAEVDANEDLRLSLALILVGTVTEEKVCVKNVSIINKIYPDLIENLRSLGANIKTE